MKRLKYIFKKLKTLDYKNMINIAGKIKKKRGGDPLMRPLPDGIG